MSSARSSLQVVALMLSACTAEPQWPVLERLGPPVACSAGDVAIAGGVGYADLQRALDAVAPAGGTVTLCAGVHAVDHLLLDGRGGKVVLRGETGDPDDVVLDGGGLGSTLVLEGGGEYGMGAFTLQHAGAPGSGESGIEGTNAISVGLDLRWVKLLDFVGAGYLVSLWTHGFSLQDSEVASLGTGSTYDVSLHLDAAVASEVVVRRSRFGANNQRNSGNLAVQSSALLGVSHRVVVDDSAFDGPNEKLSVISSGEPPSVIVQRSTFTGLSAPPALAVDSVSLNALNGPMNVAMRDVRFFDNESGIGAAAISTNGLRGAGSRLWLQDVWLGRNTSARGHGALKLSYGWYTTLRDVRFGQGANANTRDVDLCNNGPGFVRSSVIDRDHGLSCP